MATDERDQAIFDPGIPSFIQEVALKMLIDVLTTSTEATVKQGFPEGTQFMTILLVPSAETCCALRRSMVSILGTVQSEKHDMLLKAIGEWFKESLRTEAQKAQVEAAQSAGKTHVVYEA